MEALWSNVITIISVLIGLPMVYFLPIAMQISGVVLLILIYHEVIIHVPAGKSIMISEESLFTRRTDTPKYIILHGPCFPFVWKRMAVTVRKEAV